MSPPGQRRRELARSEHMTRRQFLQALAEGAASAALAARATGKARGTERRARRPNFVFILTDDQRHDAMGCAGNRWIHTPNIDALAARGVRFTRAFVTLSICSPSRATCLTGRYGSRCGVMSLGKGLNAGEKTFAHHLKAAGYRTGIVGKWHLRDRPRDCGFDYAAYFQGNGPHYDRRVVEGGRKKVAKGYIEDYSAAKCVEFMRAASDEDSPFLLWWCTQVPHMTDRFTWDARRETLARYDAGRLPLPVTWRDDLSGKPPYLKTARSRTRALTYGYDKAESVRRHLRRYYAAITDMDAAVGSLLKGLDALHLRDSTYVFFLSDNGWLLGEHGLTSKVLPYEESIRVPMILAGPRVKPGVDGHLVLNADVMPTMLELAGLAPAGNVHGRSLLPLLTKAETPWRESILYEAPVSVLGSAPLLAVRTERWKYVRTFEGKRLSEAAKVTFEELYDLRSDPHETTNLIARPEHAKVRARLVGELARLRKGLTP
jgi:arylsulfatase A-like enzyme